MVTVDAVLRSRSPVFMSDSKASLFRVADYDQYDVEEVLRGFRIHAGCSMYCCVNCRELEARL
eukprot:27562-Eustigmatos_ZCMA.PRE.1